ncbi:TELO2-interacting protein 2-like [Apostichopus japonicus]|uniref:TELO2-interacting protein 2-like n=1 Tax=Stichopus japonicus TaxID=307972 RepID=UPI003AB3B9C2
MEFGEDSIKKITRDVLEAATGGFVAQAEAGFEDAFSEEFISRAQENGLAALKQVYKIYRENGICSEGSTPLSNTSERQKFTRKVLTGTCGVCAILCASYHGNHDWSNKSCQKMSRDLLDVILGASSSPSIFRLLCGYSEVEEPPDDLVFQDGIFGAAFQLLKTRMNKTNWKKEPASRQVFWWFLSHMKHPFVGEHLNSLLPPALLFVDDYHPTNKLLGIRCLQHIVNEVDPTELRWYGRSEVIYEALEPLLYQQEGALMRELLPCLLSTLAVSERKQKGDGNSPGRPNRYDKVFQIILCNMEGEQKLALRREFAKFLPNLIKVMKITVLRHMKRLLRVIVTYMEVSDGKEEISRSEILEALKVTIIETWPRIPAHSVQLTKVLLILLSDISSIHSFNITSTARENLRKNVEECLRLLQQCDEGTVQPALRGILETSALNQFVRESLERVLENG